MREFIAELSLGSFRVQSSMEICASRSVAFVPAEL